MALGLMTASISILPQLTFFTNMCFLAVHKHMVQEAIICPVEYLDQIYCGFSWHFSSNSTQTIFYLGLEVALSLPSSFRLPGSGLLIQIHRRGHLIIANVYLSH